MNRSDPANSDRRLRLAIVTRRFWPYAGTTEFSVADFATELKNAGHEIDIVTVRWEKTWPSHFHTLELPVHRVNRPTTGPWGSFRYLRALMRQLGELAPDGIIVVGLGDEAWSISKTFGEKIPCVIRIDNHQLGFRDDQPSFTARQISALNSAAGVLVESAWTAERILRHPSVKTDAISVVRDGVHVDLNYLRTPARYGSARVALSDAHPVLMIEATQPLVVCGSPLHGDDGLIDLVNAWAHVIERFPNARLWILGDGTKGRKVWEHLLEKHMVHSVIMPGSFDELGEVFQAADLYVHPLRSDESCGFLTRAMVGGVCSIVTSTRSTRELVENNISGLVVGVKDARAMADAIILALGNDELRERLGRAGLKSAVSAYDIKGLVSAFVEPFLNWSREEAEPASLPADEIENA